jgi:very-short-patch-repair endonuclease
VQINNHPELCTLRKTLRKSLTSAEAKLWTMLKDAQLDGRKFRRQHSVGRYILDFYCPSERLAIELDGSAHDSAAAQDHDHERTRFLENQGIKVLRFENKWVFQESEAVLITIKTAFGWVDSD